MHRRPAQLCRYPSVGVRAARSSGVKLCKLWRLPAAPDHICPPPIELLFAGYRASSELVSLCRRRLMRLGKHVSSSSMHQTKPHMTQSEPRMPASQRRIGRPETHCNRSKASARRGRADSSTCRPKILVTVLTGLDSSGDPTPCSRTRRLVAVCRGCFETCVNSLNQSQRSNGSLSDV
jgi:hypothetical protein